MKYSAARNSGGKNFKTQVAKREQQSDGRIEIKYKRSFVGLCMYKSKITLFIIS